MVPPARIELAAHGLGILKNAFFHVFVIVQNSEKPLDFII